MNGRLVLWFLVVDILLVLTPGADWLYVIARSLDSTRSRAGPRAGHRAGLVAVGGICTAYLGYTALVASGLAAAVAAAPGVLPALRYAGAAYLVLLAIGMLRGARSPSAGMTDAARATAGAATPATVYVQSMLTGLLNPKALLLFLSLLPQFTEPSAALPVGLQLALLGLLHVVNCALGYGAVALAANRIGRTAGRSGRAARVFPVVSAVLLLAVAAVTLL